MAWLARHGNARLVLGLRVADESREVRNYPREGRADSSAEVGRSLRGIARDEASHAQVLSELKGNTAEPWHNSRSGGFLRNVIYGFNDGLTANFGLVMGILGAQATPQYVLLSGISGIVADSLSMGGSGFLAAKSEQEVWQHEIAMEREEIELMPEVETEELALLYEAKGMPAEAARRAATQVMADPAIALQEKAREELGIAGGERVADARRHHDGRFHGGGGLYPRHPLRLWHGPGRHLDRVLHQHAGSLCRGRGTQPVHRPRHHSQRRTTCSWSGSAWP